MQNTDETGAPTKKKSRTGKTAVKKKASPRTAASKKLTSLEQKMAEFQASLADLKAKTETVATPFGLSGRLADWVTKNDMPTVPEIRQYLWAGVKGTLEEDQQEMALLIRELTAGRGCLLCGASSHASMAPPTPWSKVRLCKCPLMASKEDPAQVLQKLRKGRAPKKAPPTTVTAPSPGFVDVLPGWLTARQEEDGGIAWLSHSLDAGDIKASTVVYRKTCRCGADFPIYALTIAQVVDKYALTRYVESNKCLPCARQAEVWRQNRDTESLGVAPRKRQKERFATLRDVTNTPVETEATQSAGAA